ncbi:MAG: permease [Syntrophales bacterium]|nr:permease [Syntrophales bacterium]
MIAEIVIAGFIALKDYVATHILTCLVPAFLLAGAMVAFINQQAILNVLGEQANKLKSFSLASLASFFVAACSCTVIPVSAGLYYSGAAVGVAFIVLWVAPSANLLSLIYTGNILGGEIVAARVASSLMMAFAVGWFMTIAFQNEKRETNPAKEVMSVEATFKNSVVSGRHAVLLFLIVLSLLLPNYVARTGPYIEKVIVWSIATFILLVYVFKSLPRNEIKTWLRESLWFVRIILPLLLAGVFLVGVVGKLIPEEWIRAWLGGNSFRASFLATLIGAISYFATMTEAPFVDTLMKLGMGKGPALALLLTGPGLSLPNWIAIARVFGVKKSVVYVTIIIFLGTFIGWFFGNFIL